MCILYRGPFIDASYQVSVHLAKGFQRRRLKCEKLKEGKTQSDGKSSHCLWQLTFLLSPCYASWHIGQGQVSSILVCCWLFFLLCPRCILFPLFHFRWCASVVFGLPLFLFPSGVHLRVTFVMSSDGLRRTWPSHLHLFWINKVTMSLVFVTLEILFAQNIFIIFLTGVMEAGVCWCLYQSFSRTM
jgi:hypothetical protein